MVTTSVAVRKPTCYSSLLIIVPLAFAAITAAKGEPATNNVVFNPTPIADQKFPLTGGLPFEIKPAYEYPMLIKNTLTPNALRLAFCYAGGGCGAAAGGGGG